MKRFISIILCISIVFSLSACSLSRATAVFSIGVEDNITTYNPINAQTQAEHTLRANCYEGLLRFDAQGKINLAGATAYTIKNHGLSYIFKLNPNAKWYASSETKAIMKDAGLEKFDYSITAQDYAFGFELFKNHSDLLDCVKEMKATDDFTLEINLKSEDYDLLYKLASLSIYPCDKSFYDALGEEYASSAHKILYNGPYYIEEVAQNEITITKSPKYNGNIQVKTKQVHIYTDTDKATQLEQLKNGSLNLYIASNATEEIKGASPATPTYDTVWGFAFNCKSKLGSSKAFREVLMCSIADIYNLPLPAFAFDRSNRLFPETYIVGDTIFSDFASEPVLYKTDTDKAINTMRALHEKYNVKQYAITFAIPYDMKATAEKIVEGWKELFGEKIVVSLSLYNKDEAASIAKTADYDLAIIPISTKSKTANSIFNTISGEPCYYDNTELLTAGKDLGTIASTNFNIYAKTEAHIISRSVFIPVFTTGKVLYTNKNYSGVYIADGGSLIYFHSGEEL